MRILRIVSLLIAIAAIGSLSVLGQRANLEKYEDGGTFEFSSIVDKATQVRQRARIREFVWDHWTAKRRGLVQITFWSEADDPATYNLYIEPDKEGRWGVTSDYRRQCCIEAVRKNLQTGIHFNTGVLYYMTLERRATLPGIEFDGENVPLDTPVYGKPMPTSAKRSGAEFVLLFRREKQGGADWIL